MDAARRGVTPAASLMIDALTARACFESANDGNLSYFGPVATTPGFPRAVRRTVTELRLAGLSPFHIKVAPVVGKDVGDLLEKYEEALDHHAISDLADLFERAAELIQEDAPALARASFVFLDVPLRSYAEQMFIAALSTSAGSFIATIPDDDTESRSAFERAGITQNGAAEESGAATLDRVRECLFGTETLEQHVPDETVTLFSAPGEGREAIEITRFILSEAARGVPFDEIAILLRTPAQYVPHLETACRRAGIPFYLAAGARRPDAAGRAFLALLACGAENLSARRFAEYLSLGQVPRIPNADAAPSVPSDPTLRAVLGLPDEADEQEIGSEEDEARLREPWKWEEFIVEAAVLGSASRWDRRLGGLEREYALRLQRATAEDPQGPQATFLRRDISRLLELRAFAVPVIALLEDLRRAHTWGEWLDRLVSLARTTLKAPERVLRALADLRPMASVGPVSFADVVGVLQSRLSTLERPQPPNRFGRVFIAPLDAVRGRSFRTVFVPGVGERAFPMRLREDPILLDQARAVLSDQLERQDDRSRHERLLLRLAVGAAQERLFVSYSRMDVREGRGRVSSFYALDVARVMRGAIPDYEVLEREAAQITRATMAWPAPVDPATAIDVLEHDLATLRPLLLDADPTRGRGRANYLLQVHAHLGRALRSRRARWKKAWTTADGMWAPGEIVRALLQGHALTARPYSASALERFAVCPYKFYLASVVRLTAREEPERIEAIDPRTRGTIVHEMYAAILRALQGGGLVPLTETNLPEAHALADATLDAVAARYFDDLAPAIEAIWRTEIEAIRTDTRIWLAQLATSADEWLPIHAELGFGLPSRADLDPASVPDPVVLADGWQLRGSIDLVEQSRRGPQLRVRDYKTGENKTRANLVVGAGETLQPTLYGLVAEHLLGRDVVDGRLWFVSSRAGFTERSVRLGAGARHDIGEVLSIIDTAVREGALGAAPRKQACAHCDFRTVCGPYEEIRITKKHPAALAQLLRLREMP
jgi:ATP-dependent helicase/nuclease subunit B